MSDILDDNLLVQKDNIDTELENNFFTSLAIVEKHKKINAKVNFLVIAGLVSLVLLVAIGIFAAIGAASAGTSAIAIGIAIGMIPTLGIVIWTWKQFSNYQKSIVAYTNAPSFDTYHFMLQKRRFYWGMLMVFSAIALVLNIIGFMLNAFR